MSTSSRRCGHLSQPQHDCSKSDNGAVIPGGFFEAGCNAAELLELAEAAFHEMALRIEMLVQRIFERARRVVGNDGDGFLRGDVLAQVIGVVGCVRHDNLGREAFDQGCCLRGVALLTCGQDESHWAPQASNGQMYFGAQATTRAAKRLIFRPPFLAPAACWWARTMVESTIRYSKSGSSDIAWKMRSQTPLMLHRLKRRNTLFQSPN